MIDSFDVLIWHLRGFFFWLDGTTENVEASATLLLAMDYVLPDLIAYTTRSSLSKSDVVHIEEQLHPKWSSEIGGDQVTCTKRKSQPDVLNPRAASSHYHNPRRRIG